MNLFECFFEFDKFIRLCEKIKVVCGPATVHTVCLLIAFLARKFEYTTILTYTASIISLHHFHNFCSPDMKHFMIKQAFSVVQRQRKELPFQRKPIWPQQLQKVSSVLDKVDPVIRKTFWATCLTAFFSLARSANLFEHNNQGAKHLLDRDVKLTTSGAWLSLPILKNNRFQRITR